ncbi:MAG: 6-phosphofructokinase [Candidatus Margulisiibacteriota bacterium]
MVRVSEHPPARIEGYRFDRARRDYYNPRNPTERGRIGVDGKFGVYSGGMTPPLLPQRINLFKVVEKYGSLKSYMLSKGMIQADENPTIIGVFHAGGPAPGANAGIRQLLMMRREKTFILAFEDGCDGLMNGNAIFLSPQNVWGKQRQGGVMIGTERTNPNPKQREQIRDNIRAWGIKALVAFGGDDTQSTAKRLNELGIPSVGIPKTIDGDLPFTNTYGQASFVKHACDTIWGTTIDGGSRNGWFVSQIMGRKSGKNTLEITEAVEATRTFIREEFSITGILELAELSRTHPILQGKLNNIVKIIRVEGKACDSPEDLIAYVKNLRPLQDEARLTIDLNALVRQLVDLIIQRGRVGARYGMVNLAEGLIDKLPIKITEYDGAGNPVRGILKDIAAPDEKKVTFDEHGNPKFSKVNLAKEIVNRVQKRLRQELDRMQFKMKVVFEPMRVGYGERSKDPIPQDINLAKILADKAMELIYQGQCGRMVTYWQDKLDSIPYADLPVDHQGHIIPRSVSLNDPIYLSVAAMELHKQTLKYLVPPENLQE